MDIREKLRLNYYDHLTPYPKKPNKNPIELASGLYKKDLHKYNEEINAWNDMQTILYKEFEVDALDHVGLQDHPKKFDIYHFAYEQGHANGLTSILDILEDMAHLFKD